MINVENITKSYGAQVLFKNAGFKLNARERVGLVGRNGYGKTTLFRLIIGEEQLDSGTISIPKGYSIGHVRQEPEFTEDTVLKEGCRGLRGRERHKSWKVEKVLSGLGFSDSDMQKHPSRLSGGFQVRLNLVKVLVRDVDLLLLDEPNNYLDITSIRWLTRYLNAWKGELMLITHDRSFMDNVVTHTVGIHRKTFKKIKGNTGKLYSQIAMEEEVYERTRLKDEKRRKKTEEFIRRFRAKARLVGLVQSRIKTLEKQKKLERLEKIKDLDFSFTSKPFNGKPVMIVRNVSFGYEEDNPLFSDLSFSVGPYDRIFVVGKNGKGKTTLLKILAEKLEPLSGEVSTNITAATAYYEQANVESLVDERTVLEEIIYSDSSINNQAARNISGMMMFEGDNALKKIRVLSGGEKSRVMLGKIIATPVNLLLLDEPTNHLDMEACDALLEAINDFDGAVVMVTHNELLLHGLAERLIVFQGGRAGVFEGSYKDFLETRGWEDEKTVTDAGEDDRKSSARMDRKMKKKLRAEIIKERSKVLKPLEKRIRDLEDRIIHAESELGAFYEAIHKVSGEGGGGKIDELSRKISFYEVEIGECYERLDITEREYGEKSEMFKKRLDEFDNQQDVEE
jgi:ATP-binding cassette subfamily F protein 3